MKQKMLTFFLSLSICASAWAQAPKLQVNAEQGNAEAQYQFCNGYNDKSFENPRENKTKAITWCRKAAEQGHAEAQFLLGWILGNGWYEGNKQVGLDEKETADWYLKAAKQGHKKAQYNLSVHLAEGIGVAKNCKEAASWRKISGEQGAPICL